MLHLDPVDLVSLHRPISCFFCSFPWQAHQHFLGTWMHDTQYCMYELPIEWDPPFWTKDVRESFMIRQQGKLLAKKVLVKLFNVKDDG